MIFIKIKLEWFIVGRSKKLGCISLVGVRWIDVLGRLGGLARSDGVMIFRFEIWSKLLDFFGFRFFY